ncbi:MAG: hypothetical protein ACLSXD_07780, partial [Lawsonibacter sp.]
MENIRRSFFLPGPQKRSRLLSFGEMILTWILLKSAATIFENYPSVYSVMALPLKTTWSKCFRSNGRNGLYAGSQRQHPFYTSKRILKIPVWDLPCIRQTSVYKGYKQDKIEMRG